MKNLIFVLVLGALAGCGHKQVMTSPPVAVASEPVQEATSRALPEAVNPEAHLVAVRVNRGDCLWLLAERNMESPFHWPALWKENRDFITDPDLVEEGEFVLIPDTTEADKVWAQDVAEGWHK